MFTAAGEALNTQRHPEGGALLRLHIKDVDVDVGPPNSPRFGSGMFFTSICLQI